MSVFFFKRRIVDIVDNKYPEVELGFNLLSAYIFFYTTWSANKRTAYMSDGKRLP